MRHLARRMRSGVQRAGSELHYLASLHRHAAHLPTLSLEDARLARALERDAFAVTHLDALDVPGTAALMSRLASMRPRLANLSPGDADDRQEYRYSALLDPMALVAELPEAIHWGLSPRILDIMERVLGLPPRCLGAFVRRDLAGGASLGTRRWHLDQNDRRYPKIIVYLSDMDEHAGPTQILPLPLSERLRATGHRKSLNEDEVGALADDAHTITGPAGTVLFVDTARVYHRGKRPERDRLTLMYSYASARPARPDLCGEVHFRPAAAAARSLPGLSERQRAALIPVV